MRRCLAGSVVAVLLVTTRARITGFSLDVEPPQGEQSVAFVNLLAEFKWRLRGTNLSLSADAGTAWMGAGWETLVNGTSKLLGAWLVDLCDEAILMDYDRNESNLIARAAPYLSYADARPGKAKAVTVGVAIASPGAAPPTWWQCESVAELEALIASVDGALSAHASFSHRYAVFFAATLYNASGAAPAPPGPETKTLWYLDDEWIYNLAARDAFFAFAQAQHVVEVYDAQHAGDRPHIGANATDTALYADFIKKADALGIDVQFMSGLDTLEQDLAFIASVNADLARRDERQI